MNNNISLPFNFNVPYKTYPSSTYPLSIASSHYDISNILASYYINICFPKLTHNKPSALTPFLRCDHFAKLGLFESEQLEDTCDISSEQAVIEWIIESIKNRWYVYSTVNEYYVIKTESYQQKHFPHPGLIYGCNFSEKTFNWAAYLYLDNKRRYNTVCMNFTDAFLALTSMLGERAKYPDWQNIIRVRPCKYLLPQLDLINAGKQIGNYLKSRGFYKFGQDNGISEMPDNEWVKIKANSLYNWGLDTYSTYSEFLINSVHNNIPIDMRSTRAFMEHKNIMERNLALWSGLSSALPHKILARKYHSIVQWAHALHLLSLNYNSSGRTKICSDKLIQHVKFWDTIRDDDEYVLRTIVCGLQMHL